MRIDIKVIQTHFMPNLVVSLMEKREVIIFIHERSFYHIFSFKNNSISGYLFTKITISNSQFIDLVVQNLKINPSVQSPAAGRIIAGRWLILSIPLRTNPGLANPMLLNQIILHIKGTHH